MADEVAKSGQGAISEQAQRLIAEIERVHAEHTAEEVPSVNTQEGEMARAALGIDGTAGDAQDIHHPFVPAPDSEACLVCGLNRAYRKHQDPGRR